MEVIALVEKYCHQGRGCGPQCRHSEFVHLPSALDCKKYGGKPSGVTLLLSLAVLHVYAPIENEPNH